MKTLFENELTVKLTSRFQDGRLNSAIDEENVIVEVEKILTERNITIIKPPTIRFWYDFAFMYNETFYPVNIKITSGKSADNVSSKEGLFYALTGERPEEHKLNTWERYIQALTAYYNVESTKDYYFLVVFKDTGHILFTSLLQLQKIVPNGNNLPFQCNWKSNIIPTNHSIAEQKKFLLDSFISSYVKRAPGLEALLNWRKEL